MLNIPKKPKGLFLDKKESYTDIPDGAIKVIRDSLIDDLRLSYEESYDHHLMDSNGNYIGKDVPAFREYLSNARQTLLWRLEVDLPIKFGLAQKSPSDVAEKTLNKIELLDYKKSVELLRLSMDVIDGYLRRTGISIVKS